VSRKALSLLVGGVGFLCACASLVLMLVMGSVFADARTENITGPGVDVFLRTPFPTEGSTVVLDVDARGGKRAGLNQLLVRGASVLATKQGKGVTWGASIGGKGRGSETVQISFVVPETEKAGDTMHLAVDVDYVVAMSQPGGFTNDPMHATVRLELEIYTSSGRVLALLARVLLGLGCFLVWFMIVWGVAKLYAKAGDDQVSQDASEMEGIGLVMGFLGGSILGYWLFAFRVMNALELRSTSWTVLLMTIWCVAPLLFVWKWNKRRKNRSSLPSARVVAR
jgi:hypothetical protein